MDVRTTQPMTTGQKAREAAGEYVNREGSGPLSMMSFEDGYLSGHAAATKKCEAEIAALRQKLAEAEGRAAKWVKNCSPEGDSLFAAGWRMAPYGGEKGMLLMVPPVPLPEASE